MKRDHREGDRYNTAKYFRPGRNTGDSRVASQQDINRAGRDESLRSDNYTASDYDDLNTGKYENYGGGGYYGGGYGSVNSLNTGRDYEQNAGYRDSYNRLTVGQWPEIERAERQRAEVEHRQGLHRGKGPRNYQRSDARIREDIHDTLREDPYVDASDIEVNVENGRVVLSGVVEDKNEKRRAEDILEDLSGIKNIENKLRTRRIGGRIVNVRNHEG